MARLMNHGSDVFLMQMITAERIPLQHYKTCVLAHACHGTERKQMYEEIGRNTTLSNSQKILKQQNQITFSSNKMCIMYAK